MTLLHDAVDSKKFDSRVVEKNIQRGLITQADLEKHLQSLPDDAENGEWVTLAALNEQQGASGNG